MATPLHYLGIAEAAELIQKKSLSPVELIDAILARIEAVEPKVHAFAAVLADHARREAKAAEAEMRKGHYRGPLHGVPIAVKDIIYSKGVATKAGSRQMQDFVPTEDATSLAKLREALPLNPSLIEWSRQDTDLISLHQDPDFEALHRELLAQAQEPV